MEEKTPERVTLGRLLADAAVLGLLGPAILFFSGHRWQAAYYTSLGVADPAVIADPPTLMVHGFWVIIGPVAATALVYGLVWTAASIQDKRAVDHVSPAEVPLLGWAAAGALFAAALSLIMIKGLGEDIIFGYSLFDLGVLFVMTPMMALLVFLSLHTSKVSQLVAGRNLSGLVVMSIILVGGLAAHAEFSASGEANDLVWGCIVRPAVQLEAPEAGITNNTTYVVLAHSAGFLYIRDSSLSGTIRDASAIPDDKIILAHFSYLPANDCR